MAVREIDPEMLQIACSIFNDYKARGVITKGNFNDMSWSLTDQTRNVGLNLITFDGGEQKRAMSWIGCNYRQYVECVKAYLVFNLGEIGLASLQEIVRVFMRLATAAGYADIADFEYTRHIIALLQIIPHGNEQRDGVIEELEERLARAKGKRREGRQRQLADFRSYLRFHDVLQSFWQTANKRQKLFYFPIYFWWNLTAILPLRPTEFLLTPRECLRINDKNNVLTVRRTKLKGAKEKINYQISGDYELKEYVIQENLAVEIKWYIRATENMKISSLDTLLAQSPHFAYLNGPLSSSNKYYSYGCMNTCLRMFYSEIIEHSGEDISRIHLGDTRHLAMTNLIITGGSPVVCRELAGHSSIEISANYYSNVSNLVECATLELYRKSRIAAADITGTPRYPLSTPADMRRVTDGWCASETIKAGGIDDCLRVINNEGNIGDCRRCDYYRPDNPGVRFEYYDVNAGKQQVEADSRYLIRIIELVRKGLGYEEDILSALLRLQRSSDHYGKCLWEKYAMEEV